MPIIFGWRTRASIIARGMFLCPQCGADRHYAHKSMRRWFTLFFIPLIPLKTLGEFVECETCHSKYKTSVLSTPTTASLQEELVAAFREAVVTLLRTGRSPLVRPSR